MPLRAPVAQLDRALACGAKGRKFESCQVYQDKPPTFRRGFVLFALLNLRPQKYDVSSFAQNERASILPRHTKSPTFS